MPDHDKTYGIYRAEANDAAGAGWRVFFQRQGCRISRAFQDSVYGSSNLSLAQARAYRDAVLAALPPRTNVEQAVLLRSTNQSGISGVRYASYSKGPFWMAMIETRDGRRTKSFSVSKYGCDQARSLAIAQRQAWLKEHPVSYVPTTEYAEKAAKEHFANQLTSVPGVLPYEHLSKAEVKSRLEAIDAHFDALRPPRILVRVRCYQMSKLGMYISDAGRPAKNKQMYIGLQRQSLEEALTKAKPKIESAIASIYTSDVARWFMDTHGNHMLNLQHFDPHAGFSVLFFVPIEVLPKISVQ